MLSASQRSPSATGAATAKAAVISTPTTIVPPTTRAFVPAASPATTSRPPTASTVALVGNAGTSTKPVTNVPVSAPAVDHADSRPTTDPVLARSSSCSFAVTGVTVLSTAAGRKNAAIATGNAAPSCAPSN